MKNKTEFYSKLHRLKDEDRITGLLWEARKLATIVKDSETFNGINGALRIRFKQIEMTAGRMEE